MILRNCWGSCSFWLLLAATCCRNKSRKSRRVHGFNKILNTGKQSLSPCVIFLKHLQLAQNNGDRAGKRTLLTILFPLQAIEGEQTNNKKIWAQETINQQQAPAYLSLSAWSLLGKALLTISSSLFPRKTKQFFRRLLLLPLQRVLSTAYLHDPCYFFLYMTLEP